MVRVSSWAELETVLKKKIDNALNKEVATTVKEEISNSVLLDVYGAGDPMKYDRRYPSNDSLASPKSMNHTVKDGTLIVSDDAERTSKSGFAGVGYDTSVSLTENIVEGYANKDKWYNQPRDFISTAVDNLETRDNVSESLKDGLRKQGLTVL